MICITLSEFRSIFYLAKIGSLPDLSPRSCTVLTVSYLHISCATSSTPLTNLVSLARADRLLDSSTARLFLKAVSAVDPSVATLCALIVQARPSMSLTLVIAQ